MDLNFNASTLYQLDWLSLIIGAILSLIIGLIVWKITHRKREILILYSCTRLHTVDMPMVKIYYKNKEINQLTRVRFLFLNIGDKTINKEDSTIVVQMNEPENIQILDYKKVESSLRRGIKFVSDPLNNTVSLNFNHLDSGDYAMFDSYIAGEIEKTSSFITNESWLKGGDKITLTEHYFPGFLELYASILHKYLLLPFIFSFTLIYMLYPLIDITYWVGYIVIGVVIFSWLLSDLFSYQRASSLVKIYGKIPKELIRKM